MILTPSYENFLGLVLEKISPQGILDFQISPNEQARALLLLEKSKTGGLSELEAEEFAQMQQLDLMLSLLKAKALAATLVYHD